jgi:hypothetical protein
MTILKEKRQGNSFEEMSALRKKDSGLPVNLYLDDTGSHRRSGHWKRIKFQGDHGDRMNPGVLIFMSISDTPEIYPQNIKVQIPAHEVEQVRTFVIKNRDLLSKLADENISIADFLRRMVR